MIVKFLKGELLNMKLDGYSDLEAELRQRGFDITRPYRVVTEVSTGDIILGHEEHFPENK